MGYRNVYFGIFGIVSPLHSLQHMYTNEEITMPVACYNKKSRNLSKMPTERQINADATRIIFPDSTASQAFPTVLDVTKFLAKDIMIKVFLSG
jgi:hypothetical protein